MKNVGIIINTDKDKNGHMLEEVKKLIERTFQEAVIEVYKDSKIDPNKFIDHLDFLLSIGGDGTILRTAKTLTNYKIPVLAVNIGHLGFISSIEYHGLKNALKKIKEEDFIIEERTMLKCEIIKKDKVINYIALNEAVATKGTLSRIVEFDVAIDGINYSKFKADGIIISTPTGSTAYSLSAGGPVIIPTLDLFTITPICPHLYGMRTLVIGSDSKIRLMVKKNHEKVYFTIDGQESIEIEDADIIYISKFHESFKLIRLKDYNYLNVLNRKIINRIKE